MFPEHIVLVHMHNEYYVKTLKQNTFKGSTKFSMPNLCRTEGNRNILAT